MKIVLFFLAVFPFFLHAQEFSAGEIQRHIKILANDSLEGRGTGTRGERMAAAYIQQAFKTFKLKPAGEGKSYLQAFPFRAGAHGEGEGGTAYNVVGLLDNNAKHTVIIGAHYDHLGMDGQASSLDANPKTKIHNGADDNASGVAGLLELARYFSTNNRKEKHNFLFICFSGEELGLLGSKYFTEHPSIELSRVNFMINMDMIGRLDEKTKTLMINGTGTSAVWESLLQELSHERINIKTYSSGIGPSDHTSFYLKNIPALHFFTGAHADYHKPTDDWDKINFTGQAEVLSLIARVIDRLDVQPRLTFLPTRTKPMATRSAFKVTLGIMPSYASEGEGLRVDGVTEGKPGDLAGIQTGDVIIQMGDYPVKDIYAYMDALGKFTKGETTVVKVLRGKEELTLYVTF
jgi:hypothetical protein